MHVELRTDDVPNVAARRLDRGSRAPKGRGEGRVEQAIGERWYRGASGGRGIAVHA